MLLANGSNLEERHPVTLHTPLHIAAINGNKSLLELLLYLKADVSARDNKGFTPLMCAAQEGYTEVCEQLLEKGKASIEETTPDGCTALTSAAIKGHSSTVELLLSKGAKVNKIDLLLAAQKGHTKIYKQLAEFASDHPDLAAEGFNTVVVGAEGNYFGKSIETGLNELLKR